MKSDLCENDLVDLVAKQINTLFLYSPETEAKILTEGVSRALKRCEHCFAFNKSKYYHHGKDVFFNPFHSDQYSVFLYFLSNSIYSHSDNSRSLADRIYFLNKCLNGFDLFYEVEMPDVFFLEHPVGSVIGRGNFGDGFSFSQNCTIGSINDIYPIIGKNVSLMSGAKIIGDCKIGNHCIIAANTFVKNTSIDSCSIVFGASPDLVIKTRPESYFTARDKV